jgi:hypothetical protein
MAETSGYWSTSAAGTGHQVTNYTQAIEATANAVLAACSGFQGVAPGYLNALACAAAGANTVSVNTGGGVVDGHWYNNSASVNVTVPSAVGGGNTRIDRIVLRCTWASYETVITRIAGTDAASPTAPAITQTSGTTYDIQLCQALVDTAGTVTVTDERVWASRGLISRQGGGATNWSTPGTTNYTVSNTITQCGVISVTIADGASSGFTTITFPRAFAYEPIVVATQQSGAGGSSNTTWITVTTATTTAANLTVYRSTTTGGITSYIGWLAIGSR